MIPSTGSDLQKIHHQTSFTQFPPKNYHGRLIVLITDHRNKLFCINLILVLSKLQKHNSSAWRQKGLTGYCFKYIDRGFCLRTDELYI